MELTIKGTEQEIKNTLQAIGGGKERVVNVIQKEILDTGVNPRSSQDLLR